MRGDSFPIEPFFCIGESQHVERPGEIRVQFQQLLEFLDRFVVLAHTPIEVALPGSPEGTTRGAGQIMLNIQNATIKISLTSLNKKSKLISIEGNFRSTKHLIKPN